MERFNLVLSVLVFGLVLLIVGAFTKSELTQNVGFVLLFAGALWYFMERRKHLQNKKKTDE